MMKLALLGIRQEKFLQKALRRSRIARVSMRQLGVVVIMGKELKVKYLK